MSRLVCLEPASSRSPPGARSRAHELGRYPGSTQNLQPLGGPGTDKARGPGCKSSGRKHKSDFQRVLKRVEILGERLTVCSSQENVVFLSFAGFFVNKTIFPPKSFVTWGPGCWWMSTGI